MKTKKGMALIMVLVMIIIFSSLILAVVISSTTAIRRAHFYKDKTTALQIAESGIQDAFYWLNYKGHDQENYPANKTYFKGRDNEPPSEAWTGSEVRYNPTDIPYAECRVLITTTGNPNQDTFTSTGYYKGRSATVSVNIRGENTSGVRLNNSNQGISDAFNKKVIYAKEVEFSTPENVFIKGNITTSSTKPNPFPPSWVDTTWTETDIKIPNLAIVFTSPSTPPDALFAPPYGETYTETGYVYRPAPYPSGLVNDIPNDGVDFNGNTYIFSTNFTSRGNILIDSCDVEINAYNFDESISNHYLKVKEGNIQIKQSLTTPTNNNFAFEVDNAHSVTIASGVTITGNLVVKNGPLILNSSTVNGSILTNNNIIILGDTTINSTNSPYEAAILMQDIIDTETKLLNITSSLTLTLGENQKTAIYASSQKTIININTDIQPNYNNLGQYCIVNWSGGSSKINIGISEDVNIKGGIYSYQDITVGDKNNTIEGVLVAREKIKIEKGAITYDPTPYLDKNNPYIYKGFTGGRRKYLPMPNSWNIRW